MTTFAELPAGFADKVLSAQSTFRSVMDAMARPGSVQRIAAVSGAPSPMMRGTAAIALTLFDHDTPVWLDPALAASEAVAGWLRFHTGVPLVADPAAAQFALATGPEQLPDLSAFAQGSDEYPDRSTTIIVAPGAATRWRLTGPGIRGSLVAELGLPDPAFATQWQDNRGRFPRGIDLLLAGDDHVVGLPRTIRLAEA